MGKWPENTNTLQLSHLQKMYTISNWKQKKKKYVFKWKRIIIFFGGGNCFLNYECISVLNTCQPIIWNIWILKQTGLKRWMAAICTLLLQSPQQLITQHYLHCSDKNQNISATFNSHQVANTASHTNISLTNISLTNKTTNHMKCSYSNLFATEIIYIQHT